MGDGPWGRCLIHALGRWRAIECVLYRLCSLYGHTGSSSNCSCSVDAVTLPCPGFKTLVLTLYSLAASRFGRGLCGHQTRIKCRFVSATGCRLRCRWVDGPIIARTHSIQNTFYRWVDGPCIASEPWPVLWTMGPLPHSFHFGINLL